MHRTAEELKKEVDKLVDRGRDLRDEADRLVMQLSELEKTPRDSSAQRRRKIDRSARLGD
jgi:hypothetical protein